MAEHSYSAFWHLVDKSAYRKLRILETHFPTISLLVTRTNGRVVEGGGLETLFKEI